MQANVNPEQTKASPPSTGLRVARSPAAACLLLAPGGEGGIENPKNGDQDSSLSPAKANQTFQKHPVPRKVAEPG